MHDFALPLTSRLPTRSAALAVYLLGPLNFERALAFQRRLVYETSTQATGQISLVLCEHYPVITIGRGGSRADVRLENVLLAGRQIEIYRVNRGGGAMFHHPGQLAVYPIVPLDWHAWSVGEFLSRFQAGLAATLAEMQIPSHGRANHVGLWGHSGQLVSLGVAVKDWITYYGAQIHVGPAVHLQQYIDSAPAEPTAIGSLSEETRQAVKMTTLRSRVGRCLADAFGCDRHHVFTDHPLLPELLREQSVARRAS